ncbi:MAG: branched-chain amino acid transport system ATP-binding protein [bacterium]|jgi:branched-chain amino acid transport system ATP-binding protein
MGLAARVELDGKRIDTLSADRIVRHKLALVPERRRIFKDLSVTENLYFGAYLQKDKLVIEAELKNVYDRLPRLGERRHQHARTLSSIC